MEAEIYYSKMTADEIRWSREDDSQGYYPRRNDSDGFTIATPWRVRKIIDEKGYICGWAVSKKIETTDDNGDVTDVKYNGERYLDKAEEAKRLAERFICDAVNEQRKADAEEEAKETAEEIARANPTVAAIKRWIKDNFEAATEAGIEIQFENAEFDENMTAESIEWRSWSSQNVQFMNANGDDCYSDREVYVSVPHPEGWDYNHDGDGYIFESCDLHMSSMNHGSVDDFERRAKAIELAVAFAKYCDDVNGMVREQEKLTPRS